MLIYHGYSKRALQMWSTRRYSPQFLYDECVKHKEPYWLWIPASGYSLLDTSEKLSHACRLVSEHHNYIAYNTPEDDGFEEDMAAREIRISNFLDEPSSDDDCPTYSDGEDRT